jgi:uncharacterized protein YyaL (SSP411 family)
VGELIRERFRKSDAGDPMVHARAAMEWLGAAQDANPDGGVSHSYLIGERWMRSYPETTGYIIPTFLNWAAAMDDPEAMERAVRMADWELEMQLPDGAIPDLVAELPVVFDAGQVLFGFVAMYRHTQDEKYRAGARKAADWLLDHQDDDGVWRAQTDSGGPGRVYNARSAWAVCEYAQLTGESHYEDAMRRFLDWTLTREVATGWYDSNCLTTDTEPLLHTIAYTARGQLEAGLLLGEQKYVDASRRTAEKLCATVDPFGRMPGRYRSDFSGAVKWACLTGMAQTSILWRRHGGIGEDQAFADAAAKVNGYLMRSQDLTSGHPGLRGGIRGSFPVNGAYGRWRVLNWATKFFVDALLIERDPSLLRFRG